MIMIWNLLGYFTGFTGIAIRGRKEQIIPTSTELACNGRLYQERSRIGLSPGSEVIVNSPRNLENSETQLYIVDITASMEGSS